MHLNLFINLSIYLAQLINLSQSVHIYLSVCPSWSIHLTCYLSLSVSLSLCLSLSLHIYIYICIYIYIYCNDNDNHNSKHTSKTVFFQVPRCVCIYVFGFFFFFQTGEISTLGGSSLKILDKFTYLGSSVSSTEKDIDT